MSDLSPIRVRSDFSWDEGSEIFDGWHVPDQRWNGWATPAFEFAEAQRLMLWQNQQPGAGQPDGFPLIIFDKDADAFIIDTRNQYPGEPFEDLERVLGFDAACDFEGVGHKTLHLYAVGAFSWTWQERGHDLIDACVNLVRVYRDGKYQYPDEFTAALEAVVRATKVEAREHGIELEVTA